MRMLVLTPKFKRAFRKFVKRNTELQQRIEETLEQMEADVFAPALGTHKLSGQLEPARNPRKHNPRLVRLHRLYRSRTRLIEKL